MKRLFTLTKNDIEEALHHVQATTLKKIVDISLKQVILNSFKENLSKIAVKKWIEENYKEDIVVKMEYNQTDEHQLRFNSIPGCILNQRKKVNLLKICVLNNSQNWALTKTDYVFCKNFFHKVASYFSIVLHLHFP